MMNRPQAGVKAAARVQPAATASTRPAPKIGVAFAAIPLDVLKARELSPAARLAFAALANHARMKRGEVSDYTNRRLAEAAGLSIATARRALDELEGAGLVRRLYGPSQRIRLAVAITYQPEGEKIQNSGLSAGCSPAAPSPAGVAQAAQRGCSTSGPGVAQAGAGDLLRGQEETPKSPSLALQGTEEMPPDGHAAADYLRRCVAAARRGEPMPEPPAGVAATKAEPTPETPTTPPAGPAFNVGRMIQDLAAGFTLADLRPGNRRRR